MTSHAEAALLILLVLFLLSATAVGMAIRARNMQIWLGGSAASSSFHDQRAGARDVLLR
jgi:hypothetical protein